MRIATAKASRRQRIASASVERTGNPAIATDGVFKRLISEYILACLVDSHQDLVNDMNGDYRVSKHPAQMLRENTDVRLLQPRVNGVCMCRPKLDPGAGLRTTAYRMEERAKLPALRIHVNPVEELGDTPIVQYPIIQGVDKLFDTRITTQ